MTPEDVKISLGIKIGQPKKVPLEPTIEESELSHANTKKSEISIGNERKVSKLSFGGDDVRFYEKVSYTKIIKRLKFSDFSLG